MNTTIKISGLIFLTLSTTIYAQTNDILSDVGRLSLLGDKAPESLSKSIFERINQSGTNISAGLLQGLDKQGTNEQALAVYVWALGLTKDPRAVPAIIKLADQAKTETLKGNCLRSLAEIGGDKSGNYILTTLDKTKEKEKRFSLFNLLGQMQYEAALPKTIEVLECDPKEEYWRPVFVFCKMGDKAVPFLMEQLNHTNGNIRANAAGILGQWLMAPEAIQPLRDRFWKEDDVEIRGLIYCSITAASSERAVMDFLKEVVAKDKDKKMVQAAKTALDSYSKDKARFVSLKKNKQPSAEKFHKEYAELYRSLGKQGSYAVLDKSSTLADEPDLKKLHERILQRDSDEALDDYHKVSTTIWQNRYFAELK
jgi:hypothetical protein